MQRCSGPGHYLEVASATTARKRRTGLLRERHGPISCVWDPRKLERRGFIANSRYIPIFGCLP